MFKIGDKVICVNDIKQEHTILELSKDMPNWVKLNEQYTIRDILDNDFVVGVLLEEIRNPIKYFRLLNKTQEPAFATWRFKKQEIAYIRAELLTKNVKHVLA